MATNYVIVISVLEVFNLIGKNFPTRHDKYLLAEAKFDGEVMSTDPVSHILKPHFNTELAWEVDKKGLQMHRLQRSPIKLQWYAVDMELTKKETIGYMILDIRLAQEKLQSPKWYPLLNAKYQKEKPEVLLSLYLERVAEEIVPSNNECNSYNNKRNSFSEERNGRKKQTSNIGSQRHTPLKSYNGESNGSHLKPVLLSHAGCYQIGPPELCTEKFMFAITIVFAANLNKLAPPAMLKSSKGFYFYYCLFDNDVTTEKFPSLSNPDFVRERASVRICSSPELLSEYFKEHQFLEILLCSGDMTLGLGKIPMEPFSIINKHDLNVEPLCVEGSVQILPFERTGRLGGDGLEPFIGVNVVLGLDQAGVKTQGKENKTPIREDSIPEENVESTLPEQPNFLTKTACPNTPVSTSNDDIKPKNELPQHNEGYTHNNNGSNNPGKNSCNHSLLNTPMEAGDTRTFNGPTVPMSSKVDSVTRHFSFTLDLCNFQATRLAHSINLFIRYSYPFFGTSSSMVTHPDIEVHPKCEVSIPHGYCAFNFATTFALLKSTFWEEPLTLEVLHRKKGGQEQTVGTARINLFQVIDAPSSNHIVDKKQGMRQTCSCKVVVTSQEGYEIGEIYAVQTLVDFGRTSSLCDRHFNQSSISCIPQVRNFLPNFDISMLRQNGLNQDELLQAALELELWQERQREIFRAQLKDKEMQHLSVLTSEWKQRDMQRELLMQKQIQECQQLENKLKSTLKDAEMKEKQLSTQEADLARKLQSLDKEREEHQKEAKKRIETIKLEYNEMLSGERHNARDLEQKNATLLQKIKELEKEIHDQKSVIDSLRSQNKGPDVHLRTEVNILNMEKSELQQKLESALSSKQKYKMQWGHAFRQISLLQQKINLLERLEMSKKEQISAAMLQRTSSTEEKNIIPTKDELIDRVKGKVESLKSVVSPESAKILERQMSLNIENTQTVPTLSVKKTSPSESNIVSKPISNNTHSNSGANQPTQSIVNKPNTNTLNRASSADSMKHPLKSSLIPQPVKHLPDLNGNTNSSEGNLQVQDLLSRKEALFNRVGYTEQDPVIKELNAHIEHAKITTK